jgi:aminopeptidase N
VLHNWWGNGVYPDYATGNWSEGLTTFMADYFYKARESPAAARALRLAWLRDYAAAPPGAHRPLAAFRSRTHGADAAVGYGKSAMVFVMLRDLIGAEAFEHGIRAFWEEHRFRVASWDDLRLAFEASAHRSLHAFFTQWLDRAGAPDLVIVGASAEAGHSAGKLVLEFKQSAPAYALRIPVEVVTGARSETRWVDFEREHQIVTVPIDAVPDGVRLDPELRVWRALEREQLPPILRQWIIAAAPRFAIVSSDRATLAAGRELAERFFEKRARMVEPPNLGGRDPVLLIGLHQDIDAALTRLGLPPRPASVSGRGSVQVWTMASDKLGAPVAVISTRDAAALAALMRPLPHYGAQSYLVFDGSRVIERGVWPASSRWIPVTRSVR